MALLDTEEWRKLRTKPAAGSLGRITFPNVQAATNAGNVAINLSALGDYSVSWFADVIRPDVPAAGIQYRVVGNPFYLTFSSTGIYAIIRHADGATRATATVPYDDLESAGFPQPGARVHLQGRWDAATDTLSLWWRDAAAGRELVTTAGATGLLFAGWTQADAGSVFAGMAAATVTTQWVISDLVAANAWVGNIYRLAVVIDADPAERVFIDVNPHYDLPSTNPASWVSASGHTVTRAPATWSAVVGTYDAGARVGYRDWGLRVEQLIGSGAVVDVDVVATGVVGTLDWLLLNDRVEGLEIWRGADAPWQRPRVGEMRLTLDNDDGAIDPYANYAATRPGTLIRAALVSAGDLRAGGWLPQFGGTVKHWPVEYLGGNKARSECEVIVVETLDAVARVDKPALAVAAGSGELIGGRTTRLLEDAGWRYGVTTMYDVLAGPSPIGLQATTMAGNRLAELYLTADSTDTIVRTDQTGMALVTTRDRLRHSRLRDFSYFDFGGAQFPMLVLADDDDTPTPTRAGDNVLWHIDTDADSWISPNDTDFVRNDHRFARVGGTQQIAEHKVSEGVFGRVSFPRSDLICQTDADALYLAQQTNDREARTALRVDAVTITDHGTVRSIACAAIDVGDEMWTFPPGAAGFTGSGFGFVRNLIHQIRSMKGRLEWHTTLSLDYHDLDGITGGILDPAPR